MAVQTIERLKDEFSSGSYLRGVKFEDLIDTTLDQINSSVTSRGSILTITLGYRGVRPSDVTKITEHGYDWMTQPPETPVYVDDLAKLAGLGDKEGPEETIYDDSIKNDIKYAQAPAISLLIYNNGFFYGYSDQTSTPNHEVYIKYPLFLGEGASSLKPTNASNYKVIKLRLGESIAFGLTRGSWQPLCTGLTADYDTDNEILILD